MHLYKNHPVFQSVEKTAYPRSGKRHRTGNGNSFFEVLRISAIPHSGNRNNLVALSFLFLHILELMIPVSVPTYPETTLNQFFN